MRKQVELGMEKGWKQIADVQNDQALGALLICKRRQFNNIPEEVNFQPKKAVSLKFLISNHPRV